MSRDQWGQVFSDVEKSEQREYERKFGGPQPKEANNEGPQSVLNLLNIKDEYFVHDGICLKCKEWTQVGHGVESCCGAGVDVEGGIMRDEDFDDPR